MNRLASMTIVLELTGPRKESSFSKEIDSYNNVVALSNFAREKQDIYNAIKQFPIDMYIEVTKQLDFFIIIRKKEKLNEEGCTLILRPKMGKSSLDVNSREFEDWKEELKSILNQCSCNKYKFSIDVQYEDELSEPTISQNLKEKFDNANFQVSMNASITRENNKWVITDNEKIYIAKKEAEMINIYDIKEFEKDCNEIKGKGISLYDRLIPEEIINYLEKEYEEIKTVWIDCDQEEINPFWELLYVTSFEESVKQDFFWGDEFSMARIPKDYNSQKHILKVNKIDVALIINGDDLTYAKKEKEYLNEKNCVNLKEEVKKASDFEKLHHKTFNIVHVASHYDYKEDKGLLLSGGDLLDFEKMDRTKLNTDIVFLNVCNSASSCNVMGIPEKLIDELSVKKPMAWIETNWEIRDEYASDFAKCFYENFLKGTPIAESVKEARKKIKDKNIMWLAYTVYGNPFTRLELV